MLSLRPVDFKKDIPFLKSVYTSTREAEMQALDWSSKERIKFIDMQFSAQNKYYQEQFASAEYDLIIDDETPIGRLYVDRKTDEIRIIDIALLTKYRKRGIGEALLKTLIDEAGKLDLPIRIHVETNNSALKLYQRLGFSIIENQEIYFLMEWSPGKHGSVTQLWEKEI